MRGFNACCSFRRSTMRVATSTFGRNELSVCVCVVTCYRLQLRGKMCENLLLPRMRWSTWMNSHNVYESRTMLEQLGELTQPPFDLLDRAARVISSLHPPHPLPLTVFPFYPLSPTLFLLSMYMYTNLVHEPSISYLYFLLCDYNLLCDYFLLEGGVSTRTRAHARAHICRYICIYIRIQV